MTGIISPKSGKRLPVYVEEKDMQLLIGQIEFPDNWQGKTDRLLIRLFYNTGMRLNRTGESEKQPGGSVRRQLIKVIGKGNKERMIPVSPGLADEIRHYIRKKNSMIRQN